MDTKKYLSCAETAKLIRAALGKTFPGQKFSVKSKTYSGGASVTVRWVDGPTTEEVDAIAGQYESKGFDGSIDLAYHIDRWLLPDGSVTIAHTPGTAGSRGFVQPVNHPKPHPDAELVSFGASYVFCERDFSPARLQEAVDYIAGQYDLPGKPEVKVSEYDGNGYINDQYSAFFPAGAGDSVQSLVYRHIRKLSFYTTTPVQPTSQPEPIPAPQPVEVPVQPALQPETDNRVAGMVKYLLSKQSPGDVLNVLVSTGYNTVETASLLISAMAA